MIDLQQWQLGSQQIWGIAPFEEYLTTLDLAPRLEGAEQRLILIIGDPGVGKTVGSRICSRDCDRRPVYLAMPAPELLKPRGLLGLLGEPVGISFDLHCPRYEAAQMLARDSLDRPRIFILDDAHAMAKGGLLDVIRWLHDTGGHTFVLVGPPALERALLDRRDLAGRVALRHQLRLPTVDEIAPLFEGFSSEAIDEIHRETAGRMRQVMALRKWLEELAEQRKLDPGDLAPKQVQMVARHFMVKVA